MLWLLVIILVVAIVGLGTLLEVGLWILLIGAVLAALAVLGVGRALAR